LNGRVPEYMLLTHNHIDHITGLQAFRNRLNVPLAVHPADNADWLPFPPEKLLNDGEIIPVGELKIEVLYTPGHTPGSVCFKVGPYLISGDTLFPGGPGRTATPEDFQQIVKSITGKIFPLPDDTPAYPGHGPSTILKKEKGEYAVFASRKHEPGICGDVAWLTA
jgi:hydroxyacylglutathione hydrolase